jgi:butyryl-CoA dehydrogenase
MPNDIDNEFIKQIDKFCKTDLWPTLEQDEKNHYFRKNLFNQLGSLGLTGMLSKENVGGSEISFQGYIKSLQTLSKYSISYAVTVSVSSMVQSIIDKFGNENQKQKYIPELASGKEIGAFGLTESNSGSDAAALKTTAKKTNGGYILNGNKLFITSGGIAKTYIVMARTGDSTHKGISAFIVQDGTKGFKYGRLEEKMGWHISPTRELVFEDCFVNDDDLLYSEGKGFNIAMEALNTGRVAIGAMSVGLAESSIEYATKYALDRKQFEKPIFDFQGVQFLIVDALTEMHASRALVYEAAKSIDDKQIDVKLCAMAKLKASDMAMMATTNMVQVLGGYGITQEYPLERFMRDAKILQIVEGANLVQKVVIGKILKSQIS